MKTIEEYIQFAIDNWYDDDIEYIWCINWNNLWHSEYDFNEIYWQFVEGSSENFKSWFSSIIDIITSKPFIEAIARGITIELSIKDSSYLLDRDCDCENDAIDIITTGQARDIREEQLEE